MSGIRLQGFDHNSVQAALNQITRMMNLANGAPQKPSPLVRPSLSSQSSFIRQEVESGGTSEPHEHSIDDVTGLRALLDVIDAAIAQLPDLSDRLLAAEHDIDALEARIPEPVTHTQSMPSDVWTVVHNLGFIPNIEVVDSGGTLIEPSVEHNHPIAPTTTILTFFHPTSGMARLS